MSTLEIFTSINLFFNILFLIFFIVLLAKVIKLIKIFKSITKKIESIVDDAKNIEETLKENIFEIINDIKDIILRVKGIRDGLKVGLISLITRVFKKKN
ncbi:MAG TPA: hypothetical protein PKW55_00675 [Spirochaetota bacterium]|nr:hypothetical protein [Spirochaetota bacterium]HOM39252.1 hypothetical protein [Spirochaetota bacterium]HPQ49253.1 hypothetical protein [Spirochaetota bacterium]